MADKKQTKAGATELAEQGLDKVQGGIWPHGGILKGKHLPPSYSPPSTDSLANQHKKLDRQS